MLVEVCVQNLEDALLAERAGADRIELCTSLETGGITPSAGLIENTVRHLRIPVHVLVRPRVGDFCYTPSEMEILLEDIRIASELGAKGIVSGVLNKEATIDRSHMERIRRATHGLHLTFHRAFDLVPDPLQAIDQLEALGIDTILTSGQRKRALEALEVLLRLQDHTKQMTIMPGGGIRTDNIHQFKNFGFRAIHFSGTRSEPIGEVEVSNDQFSVSDLGNSSRLIMQADAVREMIRSVK